MSGNKHAKFELPSFNSFGAISIYLPEHAPFSKKIKASYHSGLSLETCESDLKSLALSDLELAYWHLRPKI